ncbi:MAG: DUF4065 domain-containing protein [Chloroflexi bacterium]|nr:DUF4065 domain-containing protein [Chloroflexota bacterium]MCY3938013.1 DUF4065 domain-containing protein [Chloroflexota bacterium]
MANANDVAAYIVENCKYDLTGVKLQKLVYYSYAWHLVWDEERLFMEPIEAWALGPVVRAVYRNHRQESDEIEGWPHGDSMRLTENERDSIDEVLEEYSELGPFELSDISHEEPPWINARGNTPAGRPSNARIADREIQDYYSGVYDVEAHDAALARANEESLKTGLVGRQAVVDTLNCLDGS